VKFGATKKSTYALRVLVHDRLRQFAYLLLELPSSRSIFRFLSAIPLGFPALSTLWYTTGEDHSSLCGLDGVAADAEIPKPRLGLPFLFKAKQSHAGSAKTEANSNHRNKSLPDKAVL
jgi:hypothetical protein